MGIFSFMDKSGKAPSNIDKAWESLYRATMKNDWAGALKHIEAIEKLDRDNPQVFMKKGDILQRAGKKQEAVECYRMAASMMENTVDSMKALAIYKIILRLAPDDKVALEKTNSIINSTKLDIAPAEGESPAEPAAEEPEETEIEEPEADEPEVVEKARAATEAKPKPKPLTLSKPAAPSGPPKSLKEAFAVHPLFSVLTPSEIMALPKKAVHHQFKDKQMVIKEDDPGDSMFIIKKGRAIVYSTIVGKRIKLASLKSLDFFGEGGFLTGRPRSATVIAYGPLEVIEIGKSVLNEMIESNPAFLCRLVDISQSRTESSLEKIIDQ